MAANQLTNTNHRQKFHNNLFGELTILTHQDSSIWFIATEVATKLGYSNPHDAISRHCKGLVKHEIAAEQSVTGYQKINIIPESDLYRLVIRSKLPEAEKFEEWVTKDILPSIRKTGGYGQPAELSRKDLALLVLKSEEEKEKLQLELKAKEDILEQAKPMIGFAETVQKAENGILVRDLAYLAQNEAGIKIGEKRLWAWLRAMGYVHQKSTRPIQEYIERGYFVMQPLIVHHHSGAQEHFTTKITGKGQIYFLDKLKQFFNTNS